MNATVLLGMKGPAAWLRLNRTAGANAINEQMRSELSAAFEAAAHDSSIRAIVICGEGRSFAAGSDVQELSTLTAAQSVALSERIARFHAQISGAEKPVIAAVSGCV